MDTICDSLSKVEPRLGFAVAIAALKWQKQSYIVAVAAAAVIVVVEVKNHLELFKLRVYVATLSPVSF
jgi:hypothetical protein